MRWASMKSIRLGVSQTELLFNPLAQAFRWLMPCFSSTGTQGFSRLNGPVGRSVAAKAGKIQRGPDEQQSSGLTSDACSRFIWRAWPE